MLANGWGVEKNESEAIRQFEKAIALKEPGGFVGMGFITYHGMGGVAKDFEKAFAFYGKAAETGDAQVQRFSDD